MLQVESWQLLPQSDVSQYATAAEAAAAQRPGKSEWHSAEAMSGKSGSSAQIRTPFASGIEDDSNWACIMQQREDDLRVGCLHLGFNILDFRV